MDARAYEARPNGRCMASEADGIVQADKIKHPCLEPGTWLQELWARAWTRAPRQHFIIR